MTVVVICNQSRGREWKTNALFPLIKVAGVCRSVNMQMIPFQRLTQGLVFLYGCNCGSSSVGGVGLGSPFARHLTFHTQTNQSRPSVSFSSASSAALRWFAGNTSYFQNNHFDPESIQEKKQESNHIKFLEF